MKSEIMLTQREKSPLPENFSSEEDQTHDTASSRTASPKHYQWAIPAPVYFHVQTAGGNLVRIPVFMYSATCVLYSELSCSLIPDSQPTCVNQDVRWFAVGLDKQVFILDLFPQQVMCSNVLACPDFLAVESYSTA